MINKEVPIATRVQKTRLMIQSLRVGVFIFILVLALLMHLSQSVFLNWSFYLQFYFIASLGLLHNLLGFINLNSLYDRRRILFFSFGFDIFLIALLQLKSDLSVSLFLFIYIFQILLSGLIFQTRGALLLAGWTSFCFSLISLMGPELKAMTFLFTMILYNVAFFVMAWISSLLAEQLEAQGLTLFHLQKLNQSIVETIPSGLFTIENFSTILTANPGAILILKNENIVGKKIQDLLPEVQELIRKSYESGRAVESEIPFHRESDNLVLLTKVIPKLDSQGDYIVMIEDVTEVRRLELMIMHQEKLAAIGGLASGIAHELGNPLAAVSANIQFLEPKIKIEDEVDKKLIANTHKEISRLGRLISEFKDFAKPEKVPVDPVQLDTLLKEVLDLVTKDSSIRQDVQLRLDLNSVAEIRGSKDKLIQAFLNIILNSYAAVQEVEKPEIQISCRMSGLEVVVRIRDNGTGMSDETKSRLFEPFYTTKGRKGTGLGLAITYKIIQSHHGKISVESEKNQFTEFTLKFPIKS